MELVVCVTSVHTDKTLRQTELLQPVKAVFLMELLTPSPAIKKNSKTTLPSAKIKNDSTPLF